MLGNIRFLDRRQQWKQLRLRHKILVISVTLIVVGAATAAAYFALSGTSEPGIEIRKSNRPMPTTVASPLTGVQVAPELAERPVTGIIIENSLVARPHSGLRQAGVAFEAIAEGGITRFLVLYQESAPNYIGPVRSLRPYFIDWAAPFQASIAHVGGSPQALQQVRSGKFRDIDQFFNSGAYWRQPTRSSPHNVYTSFDRLDALNKSKRYTGSKFTSWPRKKDQPSPQINAQTINFNISSANYNVRYSYDKNTNSYGRFMGGSAHVSTDSPNGAGRHIVPKVVIALVTRQGIASDGQHSTYQVDGSGRAFIFQDGGVQKAIWKKNGRGSQTQFLSGEGQPIALNAGQTWITVVGDESRVSYKPAPTPKPQQ